MSGASRASREQLMQATLFLSTYATRIFPGCLPTPGNDQIPSWNLGWGQSSLLRLQPCNDSKLVLGLTPPSSVTGSFPNFNLAEMGCPTFKLSWKMLNWKVRPWLSADFPCIFDKEKKVRNSMVGSKIFCAVGNIMSTVKFSISRGRNNVRLRGICVGGRLQRNPALFASI